MEEHIITKPDEMEWVTIPAGEFIMGSDAAQDHRIKELDPNFPMSGLRVSNHNERYTFLNTPLRNIR